MLKDKTIVLGISGSIAAYKGAELASRLTQAGAKVEVIMTESAQRFVTPLTLRSLTGRPVAAGMWETPEEFDIRHVSLARAADVVLVAPATANIIAKMTGGLADDLLSATLLATRAPVVVAPAMNAEMWANPATQENVARLKARGVFFVEPGTGYLACGTEGKGRLAETSAIIGITAQVLGREGDLAGRVVVVTAGGTREPIDPVRFIGNRSSGKMGYALAEAARDRGAEVILISSASLPPPAGVAFTAVQTAQQMLAAVKEAVGEADILIMAAAVADYEPRRVAPQKIKKSEEPLLIELKPSKDILASVNGGVIRVGFAAESQNLVANATHKLVEKKLDLIVANDVTAPNSGFGSDTNQVAIIGRDGKAESLPLLLKREVAEKVLDAVVRLGVRASKRKRARLSNLFRRFLQTLAGRGSNEKDVAAG
jgi:phosphopantothenoylcysteine decarboxylase / phosphopantothenate---cysteine ligase